MADLSKATKSGSKRRLIEQAASNLTKELIERGKLVEAGFAACPANTAREDRFVMAARAVLAKAGPPPPEDR